MEMGMETGMGIWECHPKKILVIPEIFRKGMDTGSRKRDLCWCFLCWEKGE